MYVYDDDNGNNNYDDDEYEEYDDVDNDDGNDGINTYGDRNKNVTRMCPWCLVSSSSDYLIAAYYQY